MAGIGIELMEQIIEVTDDLRAHVRRRFEPFEGVYRINDFAEYVSEADWDTVWAQHPAWWCKAWMLADNGQYDIFDVAAMNIDEIERAYDDRAFEPEFAYYTEVNEDGLP